MLREQAADIGGLVVAMFQQQVAAGFEVLRGLGDDVADVLQAVGKIGERAFGFEAQIALRQMRVVRADIGRIADDDVPLPCRLLLRFKPRALGKGAGCFERLGVVLRHGQRIRADVAGEHVGIGAFQFGGHGNDAAARAHVPQRAAGRQPAQCGFQQVFGFGARNQHMAVHGKRAAVKFAAAQQVGHRFTLFAPPAQLPPLRFLFGRQKVAVARDELAVRQASDVLQQQARFQARQRRLGNGLGDGGHGVAMKGNGLQAAFEGSLPVCY